VDNREVKICKVLLWTWSVCFPILAVCFVESFKNMWLFEPCLQRTWQAPRIEDHWQYPSILLNLSKLFNLSVPVLFWNAIVQGLHSKVLLVACCIVHYKGSQSIFEWAYWKWVVIAFEVELVIWWIHEFKEMWFCSGLSSVCKWHLINF
jgi:hypothetical protein